MTQGIGLGHLNIRCWLPGHASHTQVHQKPRLCKMAESLSFTNTGTISVLRNRKCKYIFTFPKVDSTQACRITGIKCIDIIPWWRYSLRCWHLDSNYCRTRCRQSQLRFVLSPLLLHPRLLETFQSDIPLFTLTWPAKHSPNQGWESTHRLHLCPLGGVFLKKQNVADTLFLNFPLREIMVCLPWGRGRN